MEKSQVDKLKREEIIRMISTETGLSLSEAEELLDIYINGYSFTLPDVEARFQDFSVTVFDSYEELFEYGDPLLYQQLSDKNALFYFDTEQWASDFEMNNDCDISLINGKIIETFF